MSGNPRLVRQVWLGGINKDKSAVLMYGGYRVRYFRVRHRSWRLVQNHRRGGVNTAVAWVGLGVKFGNPYMEAILSCRVPKTLKKIGTKGLK